MRSLYSASTFVTLALGQRVLPNHQTVFTESFARSFRLFTHSMGLGSFDGLYQ